MKKPTVKSLQRRADKLWSAIILRRAGHLCECCGEKPAIDPHHIYRKERNAHLRYAITPSNGFALCKGCHLQTKFDPMRVDMMIVAKRGIDEMLKLDEQPHRTTPWTVKAMKHVIVGLEYGLSLEDGTH